jgi:P-type Ca2+ transporter type 2C
MGSIEMENITGLTEAEAQESLKLNGYNEIDGKKKRRFFGMLIEIIKEPMFLLLLACGSIYFFLGDYNEGFMLLSFVFIIIGITFYQENKTERALEALKDLSSPRALVIRGGAQKRIAGREVVLGDILVIAEGDRVPADAIVLSCSNLQADESLLTGEPVPVRKTSADDNLKAIAQPGGDDLPFIYSGTLIVSGTGIARVKAIGMHTEIGKIGKSLESVKEEKTELQKETADIVKKFAIGALTLCFLVIIIYGLTRGNWIQSILAGITLAMSILPEEFPVVLTIFLALGAWRMSRKNVLARKQHAIQALGSATVLCTDKTGTLTMNKMTIKRLLSDGKFFDVSAEGLPEGFHEVMEFGSLASQKEPFDPMEKAIKDVLNSKLSNTEHVHADWELVQEYPLTKQLLSLSHVWKSKEREYYVIAAKGAPEAIGDLCHFNKHDMAKLEESVIKMADNGLRVIGVAKAVFRKIPLPEKQHDFDFRFIGLIGFEDPVRTNVPESVKECYDAGIRVVMITGDYPGTARNIAKQIGLRDTENIITGPELNSMSEDELKIRIAKTSIFARVVPDQKLLIVNALKANNEIVIMTGDGVNDAPALKSANIGVAMGARGTDVAREASGVVILDDDFSSIVGGIRMGRRIFDNIRKAMAYVLAVHIPIAGVTLLSVVLRWPLVLLPAHIVFLELIIDPACSVVFEACPEEKNIMKKPPRDVKEKIFNKKTVIVSVLQGFFVAAAVAAVFKISMDMGHSEGQARLFSFITLVVANLGLIIVNLSWSRFSFQALKSNRALWLVIGGATLMLGLLILVRPLQNLFNFEPITLAEVLISLAIGLTGILWAEVIKELIVKGKPAQQ